MAELVGFNMIKIQGKLLNLDLEPIQKLKIKTKEAQKPNKSVQEDSFFSRMLEDIENRKGHEDDECSDLEFAKLPIDDGVPSMFHSSAGREQSRKVNNVKNIV